ARAGNVIDRASSLSLGFAQPVFPSCTAQPSAVLPGKSFSLSANGLVPSVQQQAHFGTQLVGTTTATQQGSATLTIQAPQNATPAWRPPSLGTRAVAANCSIRVFDQVPAECVVPADCVRSEPCAPGSFALLPRCSSLSNVCPNGGSPLLGQCFYPRAASG